MKINNQSISVSDILNSVNPLKEIEKINAQIYPAKFRVETNDKFSKILFGLTQEEYSKLTNGNYMNIVEKKNHKKVGKIRSPFKVYNGKGYINTAPLTEFDRAVLAVCISNWLAGNRHITPAIIYRGLTGKVNHLARDAKPSTDQRNAIMRSIEKLMGTIVSSDMTDVCKNLKYNDGKPFKFVSALLPAYYIEATINGQDATVIFFDRESPLLQVASLKKQLLTFNADLLDVPNQNNTPLVITLKNYILRRIQEIKLHKMTPTLTIDDIFQKCRIADKSNKAKLDARNSIEKFFEHLKSIGEISSFTWDKKGNKIYSINFYYEKKSQVAPPEISEPDISSTENKSEISNSNSSKDSSLNPENLLAQDSEKPHIDKLLELCIGDCVTLHRRLGNFA